MVRLLLLALLAPLPLAAAPGGRAIGKCSGSERVTCVVDEGLAERWHGRRSSWCRA